MCYNTIISRVIEANSPDWQAERAHMMKDAVNRNDTDIAVRQDGSRSTRKRIASCAICTRRIWLHPVHVIEPEDVPAIRLSWVLCRRCYQFLLLELRRSSLESPLRLRIAMGMVASEYWPHAYPTRMRAYISDRRWIVFIATGFIIAMLVHLALIVMVATMK
jgi:hypothetical protein